MKSYCYFQKTCIKINKTDNDRDTKVFRFIPSLKNIPTNTAYITIPQPNPIKRAGHIIPSKCWTVCLVPQMYR